MTVPAAPPAEVPAADAAALADALRAALAPALADLAAAVAAPAPLLARRKDAARLLGIGTTLLDTLDAAGRLPAPIRVGGAKAYRRADLARWTELGCPDRERFEVLTAADAEPRGRKPARRPSR